MAAAGCGRRTGRWAARPSGSIPTARRPPGRAGSTTVGAAHLLQGLAGLPRRVLHGDRRVLDLQRVRLADQHIGRRQIAFPHRLTRPPQQVGRLLSLVVRLRTRPVGLGQPRGADQGHHSAADGPSHGSACREAQNDCHQSGQYTCGRFQHDSPLLSDAVQGRLTNHRRDSHDELGDEINKMFARRSG